MAFNRLSLWVSWHRKLDVLRYLLKVMPGLGTWWLMMVALMSRIGRVGLKMVEDSVCLHLAALKSTLIGLVGELSCKYAPVACSQSISVSYLVGLVGSCWIKQKLTPRSWLLENCRWHECSTSVKFEVQDSWLLGWGEACMVWFEYENTHGSLENTGMDRNLWMHKLDLPYSFQTAQGNWTFFKCWDVHFDHSWTDLVPNPQILLLDVLSFPSLSAIVKI